LSPDGSRIALTHNTDPGNVDIWIKELPVGPFERLTLSPGTELSPTWTPDGAHVSYVGEYQNQGTLDVWQRSADGTGEPELVLADERDLIQPDWGPEGQWMVLRSLGLPEERDILGFRPGTDTVPLALVAFPEFAESSPALSPDGRWLAYSSDVTGREQVYVRPFPNVDSGRVSVSIDGGRSPLWAHRSNELFYASGEREMVVAQFETEPEFRIVRREALIPLGPEFLIPPDPGDDFYDVAPDDQRFLIGRLADGDASQEANRRHVLVLNFFEELRERLQE